MQDDHYADEENFLAICSEIDRQMEEQSTAYLSIDSKLASLIGFVLLILAGVAISSELTRSISVDTWASVVFLAGLFLLMASLVCGAYFWHASDFTMGPYLADMLDLYAAGTGADLRAIAYDALFNSIGSNSDSLKRKIKGMTMTLMTAIFGTVLIMLGTIATTW